MRYGFVTVLVCLFTGFTKPVVSQQPLFRNYSVNDGLVSNTIRRIFQDSKGFLWIATFEGLSKYDGHRFTNYNVANGLSHNLVNDIYEAKDGTLYVALNNGAIDIIKENKSIEKSEPSPIVVNRFIQTPWQQVIATTDRNGLQEFANGILIKPKQDFPFSDYSDMVVINDTALITTGLTVSIFNRKYELISQSMARADRYLDIKIYQDKKKRIWSGSAVGLKLMAGIPQKNKPIEYISLPAPFNIPALQQKKINDIFEDANGTMWFATTGGLLKISRDGSQQLITVRDGLASNIVTCIFQDKEKNIWFGTAVGLSKLVTQSGIEFFAMENGVWSSDNSFILYPYNKKFLLVSTFKGPQVFNTLTGHFSPVSKGTTEKFNGLLTGSHQPLLIGIHRMAQFDTVRQQYNKFLELPVTNISRMIGDQAGNFFISDINRLYFNSGKVLHKILDYRISSLLIGKQGILWAGTWQDGIFRISYSFINGQFKIVRTDHFLSSENIRSLYEDSKGTIWAGTRYQGVYRLINAGNNRLTISNLDQRKGLTSNFIKGIREDAKGNFWIAFYQGLDKIIPTDTGFRVYNFSRVNSYFASVIGIETDADKSLWLATGEGITKITDGELENQSPLPVYITRVFSRDSVYSINANKIQLDYRQNQMQFEFSAPSFINEKQLLYSYRLSGNSATEWTVPNNQHVVSYASLQPGNYLFEVRMLGWNGKWGIPAGLRFTISPPFWKTGWFISLVVFCILLLSLLFIKGREKSFKTIAAEKLKVQQLNAEQYKRKLEMEQIINYFSSSLIDKNTVEDVLWDVAKNLIGRLGFVDCMMYLWNEDKTKMIQKAGFGPKGSLEEIKQQPFDVLPGQGVVGYVMTTKNPVLIPDTSQDPRYRPDEMTRPSEITVPIIYNNELIGVIDSEHPEKNFFTQQHLQILSTISTLMANKIKSIEAEQSAHRAHIEMYSMKDQLSQAKVEALRSQMNPHFIFNCLNSIDNLIQTDQKEKATDYLAKFARLIRAILENSKNNTVPCWKDLETLELYLEMEKLRWDNKIACTLTIASEIQLGDYKVPPMIVQPFIENAIHHGLLNKVSGDKNLDIDVHLEENNIKYTITDNGVGRQKAGEYKKLNRPSQASFGMQITKDRINLFNQGYQIDARISDLFNSEHAAAGTKVEVWLTTQPLNT